MIQKIEKNNKKKEYFQKVRAISTQIQRHSTYCQIINSVNSALISHKIEKTEDSFMNSCKGLKKSLIKFNNIEAISKQLTASIRC